ncbi:alpha-L-rhamnosidase C-terminal domain-containing protein [Paenibacillus sp.]|uniref:alpha-L-rhamnosidase-related protein n=1 Tax=Paenibacillus sp. TaxID=58172 RepID=UPI002D6C2F16|nr:alpha-L-rhamnosidase C-terminal domain-containing protein [Paenibacillus sp.]HZG58184.1 alpha-L-rhamnosidase C-terminal domain-containing protein [Paenibacillus sp.]
MADRGWEANWIWGPADGPANGWTIFRKTFELPCAPGSAEAWISAESKYWLWLNGRLVVFEGGLNRGPTPGAAYFDRVDLKPFAVEGSNTIAALVWYWGNEGRNNTDSGQGGLLFQAAFDDVVVRSDRSWRMRVHPAYGPTDRPLPSYLYGGHNIGFDARLDIDGWHRNDFDDGRWEQATEKGVPPCSPWGKLTERPIPLLKFDAIRPYAGSEVRDAEGGNGGKVYDAILPYAMQFTPYLKIEADREGLKLDIRSDRYAVKGGPGDSHHEYLGHRTEYTTKRGIQEFESLDWLFGERAIYTVPEGVRVLELGYRESGYDAAIAGSFACSDPFLNKLYEKCARTLYVCMRDNYMDCPDRERGQWIGDVSSQVPQTFYVLDRKADRLTVKAISDFVEWRDGAVLRGNVPGAHSSELPSQSLNAIGEFGMILSYYWHSGDASVVHRAYPAAKDYLALWRDGRDGLIEPRSGDWRWYDHGEFVDGTVLENAWYYTALKAAADMASMIGRPESEIAWFRSRAAGIRDRFDLAFWKGDGYRSEGFLDDRANALAVLAGLAGPDKLETIRGVLRNVRHASPYMEGYVLEAMFLAGDADGAMARMRERYAPLVNNENSTLWEDFEILGTRNHAWSGGPLTVLAKYAAGVAPLTPGYGRYRVMPELADLSELRLVVPSVRGNIETAMRRSGETFEIELSSPEGTEALVCIPKHVFGNGVGVGTVVSGTSVVWKDGEPAGKPVEGIEFRGEDERLLRFAVRPGRWRLLTLPNG